MATSSNLMRDFWAIPPICAAARLFSSPLAVDQNEALKLSGKMVHVEAVIKMLAPTFNLWRIAVKRRQPNPWFKRGTVYRRAVDALRY